MPPEEKHEIRGWASIKDYSSKDISLQNALVDSLVKTIICSPSTVYCYDGKMIYDYVCDPYNEIDIKMAQKDLLEQIIDYFMSILYPYERYTVFFEKQKADKKCTPLAASFLDIVYLLSEACAEHSAEKKDCALIDNYGLTSIYSPNDSYYIEITKEFREWISQNPDDYFMTNEEKDLLS